jgi:membrane protease YdiL (CAAX protease family)
MPEWATFAGFAGVILAFLLLLAHASKSVISDDAPQPGVTRWTRPRPGSVDPAVTDAASPLTRTNDGSIDGPDLGHRTDRTHPTQPALSTTALLANVAASQGAFGVLLLAGAWFTEIPRSAFGVSVPLVSPTTLATGAVLGLLLYVANEVGATVGNRLGVGADEGLREALAPTSAGGWAVLLFLVLPIIAGFEELLFRGVLVGVFAAGFGWSPWALAVVSSIAFAIGHGAQGPAGVVVTGVLGFVLAAAFVLSGSLLVVVVAHYLVNALEFVVHEGLDVDWS